MAAAAANPAAVRRAEEVVEREMSGRDASHDAAHALRVRDLALSLAAEQGLSSPDRLLIVTILYLFFFFFFHLMLAISFLHFVLLTALEF
jgi:uncharacterized protein